MSALLAHAATVELQRSGCAVLHNIAAGDSSFDQAVIDAGGLVAVVAAMGAHVADVEVQRSGCAVLRNLACDDASHKKAAVENGGLAAAVTVLLSPRFLASLLNLASRPSLFGPLFVPQCPALAFVGPRFTASQVITLPGL